MLLKKVYEQKENVAKMRKKNPNFVNISVSCLIHQSFVVAAIRRLNFPMLFTCTQLIPSPFITGTWVGQGQPMYVPPNMMPMMQIGGTSSIASGSVGGMDDPPAYGQCFPQGTFNQFPYFANQPPAPNMMAGGK